MVCVVVILRGVKLPLAGPVALRAARRVDLGRVVLALESAKNGRRKAGAGDAPGPGPVARAPAPGVVWSAERFRF